MTPNMVQLFGISNGGTSQTFPVPLTCDASGNLLVSLAGTPGGVATTAGFVENNTDGQANTSSAFVSAAYLYGYNGATFDRIRIANVYKTVSATAAGNTPVWTPTAGKKFRLMGYTIDVAGTAAATGVQVLQLRDNATVIKNHLANLIQTTTASISGGDSHMGADLGQGQLSALANNVLNINLGTAMATGAVVVHAWGTEE
jgi:hypothetical protein